MRAFFAVVTTGLLLPLLVGILYFQPVQRVAPGGCGRGLCREKPTPAQPMVVAAGRSADTRRRRRWLILVEAVATVGRR